MIDFEEGQGCTPLTPEEKEDLIPSFISTRGELNALELRNITQAQTWLATRRYEDVLNDTFMKKLHEKMFEDVWHWAGTFRKSDKNIGCDWQQIPSELKKLSDDTQYWIKNKTYPWDEIGGRFHHKLVWIHPFPNGNGRHGRLTTDCLMRQYGQLNFTWGEVSLRKFPDRLKAIRDEYIAALKQADQKDFKALLQFVRS